MTEKFEFSLRSEKKLTGVNADFVQVARLALQLSPVDFAITEGLRSVERQKKMVAQGSSETMDSRHISGHAVDVVACMGTTVSWEWPLYEQISRAFKQAGKQLNIPVEWGGDWQTLKDGPHFQLSSAEYPS